MHTVAQRIWNVPAVGIINDMKVNRVACMFCLGNYFIPK